MLKLQLLILCVATSAYQDCSKIKRINWEEFTNGAKTEYLSLGAGNTVWINNKQVKHDDGYHTIAQFNTSLKAWQKDPSQPKGAWYHIAVDQTGNVAYIDKKQNIHWKRDGKWVKLGCARRIAFNQQGQLYKISCTYDGQKVYTYVGEKWRKLPQQEWQAYWITIDGDGAPWVTTLDDNRVLKFDAVADRWLDMGLKDAWKISAGPDGQVYALAKPWKKIFYYTIYKYNGAGSWSALPGRGAWNIAVGEGGALFIVEFPRGRLFKSDFLNSQQMQERKFLCNQANAREKELEKKKKEEQRLADQPQVAKLLKDQAARFKVELTKERALRTKIEADLAIAKQAASDQLAKDKLTIEQQQKTFEQSQQQFRQLMDQEQAQKLQLQRQIDQQKQLLKKRTDEVRDCKESYAKSEREWENEDVTKRPVVVELLEDLDKKFQIKLQKETKERLGTSDRLKKANLIIRKVRQSLVSLDKLHVDLKVKLTKCNDENKLTQTEIKTVMTWNAELNKELSVRLGQQWDSKCLRVECREQRMCEKYCRVENRC